MPTPIASLGEIADAYDGFIFDVWGTLYDGEDAFAGALAAVRGLAGMGRRLVVLSNSPRVPQVVGERLRRIGFDLDWFVDIVTSGGMVNDLVGGRRIPLAVRLGERVLWLGRERFPDALPEGSFRPVDGVEAADWVLAAGPASGTDAIEDYEPLLAAARARGLPLVCANPDRAVIHGGMRQICAGSLAERYADLGGEVHYFGKPYPEIFERCLDRLAIADRRRVLVVGDNLETDILGASRTRLDSLLLAGGVHAEELDGGTDLAGLIRRHPAPPTFVAARLEW